MSRGTPLLLAVILAVAVVVLYGQVRHFDLILYDDPQYVTGNSHVRAGLTFEGIRWAFTTVHAANWFPLTWLCYMLTVQLCGVDAGALHLVNVILHAANAMLLFLLLRRLTGALWRSAVVAAIFALHPLRVESVAWVAELKDVLSAFFWLLTLHAYAGYARRPGWGRYLGVVLLFALGLMAKPMLVTLPLVLLLLDFWPLARLRGDGGDAGGGDERHPVTLLRLLLEKVPLLLLSGGVSVLTIVAQQRGGALNEPGSASQAAHLANALLSYWRYPGKMLWPRDLAVFYPLAPETPYGLAGVALLLLVAVTALLWRLKSRYPWLLVGWLWYLITLVPVAGFVQVGSQSGADRYTYIPLIGVTVMAVWGGWELSASGRWLRRGLCALAVVLPVALAVVTWQQLGHWRTSKTLFTHAVAVTEKNWLAHNNLATVLVAERKFDEAEYHVREALRYLPRYATAYNNLGAIHNRRGETDLAIAAYVKALGIDPNSAETRFNLGLIYLGRGQRDQALEEYRVLLRVDREQAAQLLKFISYADRMR